MRNTQTAKKRHGSRLRHGFLVVPLLSALLLAAAVSANAQTGTDHADYPDIMEELGLRWGMSLDDVLGLDVFTLEYMGKGDGGDHYMAVAFPPVFEDLDQVILFHGFDDRLWRVALISTPEEDGSGVGTALFVRYDAWKASLDTTYGEGQSYHRNTSPDVGRPDLILATLERGDAWHFTEYDRDDIHVQVGVKGTSMTFGHVAAYLKHKEMGEKVQADLKILQRKTGQARQEAPTTETD